MEFNRKTYSLMALICASSFLGFSQQETGSIYFPQEQIVHPDCKNSSDKNDCFYKIINNKVTEIINSNTKKVNIEKDTLKININLIADINGDLKHHDESFTRQHQRLGKKNIKAITSFLKTLPKTKVYNNKSENYISNHRFNLVFLKKASEGDLEFESIDTDNNYKGGIIEEIPVFIGCEGLFEKESKTCFQTKMQKHIKDNFRYPDAAIRNGISGKVYVIITIDKEGIVKNIRTKGPAPILEEEAHRIMSLLPKMKPGLQNGKPMRVPYSIPITFS